MYTLSASIFFLLSLTKMLSNSYYTNNTTFKNYSCLTQLKSLLHLQKQHSYWPLCPCHISCVISFWRNSSINSGLTNRLYQLFNNYQTYLIPHYQILYLFFFVCYILLSLEYKRYEGKDYDSQKCRTKEELLNKYVWMSVYLHIILRIKSQLDSSKALCEMAINFAEA